MTINWDRQSPQSLLRQQIYPRQERYTDRLQLLESQARCITERVISLPETQPKDEQREIQTAGLCRL